MVDSLEEGAGRRSRPVASARTLTRRALAIAACAALLAGGWRLWTARGAADAPAYETQPLSLSVVEQTISATGPVKARVTVDVGSQLSGLIAEMKVDFNDAVKEGALLAVIDRAPFEAKLASAAANLVIAKADIGLREAAVARAHTRIAQDERDAARFEALSPKGIVSQKSREGLQTQVSLARADLAMAAAQLESARGAVGLREAELRQAEINLDRTQIRSPINGVVVDRKMQPGQTVAADYQTPILFQIAQDLSQIQIWAQVDEADIGAVRPGAPVTFAVEAFPGETFSGVVDQVRLAATKTSGVVTYTVIIKAQNPDQKLYPEMTATARIVGATRERALNAPNQALRFRPSKEASGERAPGDAGQGVLWTPGPDGKPAPRPVRLGLKGDRSTEILDGEAKAGDPVILRARSGDGRGQN